MATDVVRPTSEVAKLTSDVVGRAIPIEEVPRNYGDTDIRASSLTFTAESRKDALQENLDNSNSSSSYILASDESEGVNRWVSGGGNPSASQEAGVQGSRVPIVQRSVLAVPSASGSNSLWYILAMVLPIFSLNSGSPLRNCTTNTVLSTAEIFFTQLANVCAIARARIQRLAQDQLARDFFAMAMDIVLVIYAIGFLVISMYQSCVFS